MQDFLGLLHTSAAIGDHEVGLIYLVYLHHLHGLPQILLAMLFVGRMQIGPALLHGPICSFRVLEFVALHGSVNLIAIRCLNLDDAAGILQPLIVPEGQESRLLGGFARRVSRGWLCVYNSLRRRISLRRYYGQPNLIDARTSHVIVFLVLRNVVAVHDLLLFGLGLFEHSAARLTLLLLMRPIVLGCPILVVKMNGGGFHGRIGKTTLRWTRWYFVLRFGPLQYLRVPV